MVDKNKAKILLSNIIITLLDDTERLLTSYSLQQFFLHELNKMYQIKKEEGKEVEKQRRKFYNTLQYLKRTQLITERILNGEKVYQLTEKGRCKKLSNKILLYQKQKGVKKFPHLIIFDIPEKYRQFRTLLRKNLYNLSYKRIQKSCFLSEDESAYELIKSVIKESGINEYVKIFEIKKKA